MKDSEVRGSCVSVENSTYQEESSSCYDLRPPIGCTEGEGEGEGGEGRGGRERGKNKLGQV